MRHKPRAICLALALCSIASLSKAQAILVYDFGTSAAPSNSPASANTHLSATGFSSHVGSPTLYSTSPGSASSGGSGGEYITSSNWSTTDGNYYGFTITPASGYQVTLTGFSFYYLSTSSGPTSVSLLSSANNFTTALAGNLSLTKAVGSPTATDWHLASPSITLTFTTTTTFRLMGTGASSSSGAFRIDDFALLGTVSAIPEPSTYAIIVGVVALGGAMWQRRRSRNAA